MVTFAEGNRYTYTGREWDDDLGRYHFRARMYDAVAGRFLGRDPIGYVDGTSLYRGYFALGSVDRTGKALPIALPVVGVGVGAAALKAAAAGMGVSVAACLLMPDCMREAKRRARQQMDDLIDTVWPRPRPEPAPVRRPISKPKPDNSSDPRGPIRLPVTPYSRTDCEEPKCKPCKPDVGTVAYRIDRYPSPPHRVSETELIDVPHSHRHEMHQSPPSAGCVCF